ncbi:MAG TPA: 4Fe-4S ferredoxin [bacterium]|nr:4Fe-4S ferredoxin [bacterium]
MSTHLYCYTGTGNSLWVARRLADALGDAVVISMREKPASAPVTDADAVGIIFPVHMWGPPPAVSAFIADSLPVNGRYYFAVAINMGAPAGALLNLRKQLRRRDITLKSGFSVLMPNVYIPLGRVQPEPKRREMFAAAEERIKSMATTITRRSAPDLETGPLWQRMVFTGLHHLVIRQVPGLDKAFYADKRCNGCGVCVRVCPAGNIELVEGRPVWQHRCQLCFSCIHWCPEEAIQYGKNTIGKERYHHPEVTLTDLVVR